MAAVWLFALAFGAVSAFGTLIIESSTATESSSEVHDPGESGYCNFFTEESGVDFYFRLVDLLILFLMPGCTIVVLYGIISVKLWWQTR